MSLDPFEIYCSYCGNVGVLIRHVSTGKKDETGEEIRRKEYLCNDCIQKDMDGILDQKEVVVDNI